jgi:hypothetical protein
MPSSQWGIEHWYQGYSEVKVIDMRAKMLRTSIVVWIVLLLLALNVAAFVTRIIEKYRLADRLSKPLEGTVSAMRTSQPTVSRHQQSQPTHR